VADIPAKVDLELLDRGQRRFDGFCAPCHDKAGSGQGTVVRRGFPAPIDLASEHTRGLADGEVFRIISFGVRNMPGHRHQIRPEDRWAIVAWVRVLERARNGALADLGDEARAAGATP
jgi:mono/diheme cytochrome c family protein